MKPTEKSHVMGGVTLELKAASIPLALCAAEDCSSSSCLFQIPEVEELFRVNSTASEHQ